MEALQMDWTVKMTDVAIIFATVLGPILAVQAQVFLERRREQHRRRMTVFYTLMTERLNVSAAHINALNAIPLEFSGANKRIVAIRTAWRVYINHMGKDTEEPSWFITRFKLFTELLQSMGSFLNYHFDSVEIEREFYAPKGPLRAQSDEETIRQQLAKILSGDATLPLTVRGMPSDPEMAALMKSVLSKLDNWIDSKK